MSLAPEDWKRFDILSGQMKIGDVSGSGDIICNASNGGWVAMCEYDEDNRISLMVAMRDYLAERMGPGGEVEVDGTAEHYDFDAGSGFLFLIDRKLDDNLPKSFKVPEGKLDPRIVDAYGMPDAEGKNEHERFVESVFHMGRDHLSQMPELGSLGFGAAFDLGRGTVDVNLLYNSTRDAIGFEISRRNLLGI